jgi:hypothetical protein
VNETQLFLQADPEANSIAILVRHLHGNMLSRWTDFLHSDGEKATRKRDREFEQPESGAEGIRKLWESGWKCTLDTIGTLQPGDVMKQVEIRGQPLSVMEAILRQLAHYSYHVGQMVTLAREQLGSAWQTLSIARGKSKDYAPRQRAGGIKE